MPVIGLFGPHAIGKTTAVRRWVARYRPNLAAAFADVQLFTDGVSERRERDWKLSLSDKKSALDRSRSLCKPIVVESCSSYGTQILRCFEPTDWAIHVYCDGPSLRENLLARCQRLGKRFNEPYWDAKRLRYESFERMHNCLERVMPNSQFLEVEIRDQARDWPAVDEYFGRLFRRLHNELNRSK